MNIGPEFPKDNEHVHSVNALRTLQGGQRAGERTIDGPIQVTFLALSNASPIDLFAAAEVFSEANRCCCHHHRPYRVRIVTASCAGDVEAPTTAFCESQDFSQSSERIDTLLVAGGLRGLSISHTTDLLTWIKEKSKAARRFGSLCSGTLLLAEAGLLNGRKATTHWTLYDAMSRKYPRVEFLPDRIFVRDGNCYTSAGALAAIDLALSLVNDDLGDRIPQEVAKRMLVFSRRPDVHPQISATIQAQTCSGAIRDLLAWMADHINEDLCVAKLAQRVAMSPRNFARHFKREVGKTPARHVSELRLEAAKGRLGNPALALKEVASASGLKTPAVLRRAFIRSLGVSPGKYRRVVT